MARRKSKNKNKQLRRQIHFPWLRYVIVVIVAAFLVVVAYRQTTSFAKRSGYFTIRDIAIDPSLDFLVSAKLSSLKGKNLFAVDLKSVQRQLQYEYPEISELKLSRRFPDQVLVTARKRIPVARMEIRNQEVLLDDDGVILPAPAGGGLDLPKVTGVNTRDWKPISGSQLRARDVALALKVLKAFRQQSSLAGYRVRRLDVGNFSNMYFYILDDIQVILDRENIDDKMKMLGLVLSQVRDELSQVKYVDLRFKEPIVGKK